MTLAKAISIISEQDFRIFIGNQCVYTTEYDKKRTALYIFMNTFGSYEVKVRFNDNFIDFHMIKEGEPMKEPFEIVIKSRLTHEALAHLKFATYSDMSDAWNDLVNLKSSGDVASYLDFFALIPDSRIDELPGGTDD